MQIIPGIYLIGSQDCFLTYTEWYSPDCEYIDANVFALDLGKEIILFDCGNGNSLEQIFDNLRSWHLDPERIAYCLITHPHYDHSGGAYLLQERGVKLVAHSACADAIQKGDARTCAFLYHKSFHPCEIDIVLRDVDRIEIGNVSIDVLHTPGHAYGSVVYTFPWKGRKISVTGDLVAETGSLGWSGSVDFNPAEYVASLKCLISDPMDIILPGHRRPALSHGYIWVEQALNRAIVTWGNPK